MKNISKNNIKLLIAIFWAVALLSSCDYQKVADADYPDSALYMPSAINGIYVIDNVPQRLDFLPTPGQTYRFTIDNVNKKLIVPLGVYRSGLNKKGAITANIAVNTDTISKLLAVAKVPAKTGILPSSKYALASSVEVPDGQEVADFNLAIDLDYLLSFNDTILGIGVNITSSQLEVNPKYSTTVLILYTKILKPIANFTSSVDGTNLEKVTFTNTSTFATRWLWDFGDGSTDTVKSPVHIYSSLKAYNVSLTAIGVMGPVNKNVKTVAISTAPPPTNLIVNGDFSNDYDNWSVSGVASITTSASDVHSATKASGSWSASAYTTTLSNSSATNCIAGTYTAKVWSRSQVIAFTTRKLEVYVNGTKTNELILGTSTNYTEYTINNISVPAGANVKIQISLDAPAGVWTQFDDFSFMRN